MNSSRRRLGLSMQANIRPLLSQIGGKAVDPPKPRRKSHKPSPEPPSVDAPPVSSSEDSDESEEETTRSNRADIQSTTFGKAAEPKKKAGSGRNARDAPASGGSRNNSTGRAGPKRSLAASGPSETSPSSQPAKKRRQEDKKVDRFEATTDPFTRSQHKKTARYGFKSTSNSKPDKTVSGTETPKTYGNGFKRPERHEFSSPDDIPTRGFVKHNSDLFALASPESPGKPMIIPDTSALDLDEKTPRERRSARRKERQKRRNSSLDSPPMASFKMPSLGTVDLGPEPDFEQLGVAAGDDAQGSTWLSDGEDMSVSAAAGPVCPMCNEKVEQALLDGFTDNKRMTISEQQRFCQHHKVASAREAWADRGYPEIDWDGLETRISKWHDVLKATLEGGPSYYGDSFSQKVKAGKSKTVLKTKESLTPGYYGSRGLRLMTESIIGQFSGLLRKRAVQDRLISARGYTAYVQSVLVPELAVRLMMEDMAVSEGRARSVLKESVWVGDLLSEELGDVVPNEESEDEREDASSSLSSAPDSEIEVIE